MTASIAAPLGLNAAVNAFLVQWASLLLAMGAGAEQRIRPEEVPAGVGVGEGGSTVVHQRLGTDDIRPLRGEVQQLHESRVQVTIAARTSAERDRVAQQVRLAMRAFRGDWGGIQIRSVGKDIDFDSRSDSAGAGERDWLCTQRYTVWHRNPQET